MKNSRYTLSLADATTGCDETALNYFPADASIPDVGIGNGRMLSTDRSLIRFMAMQITGGSITTTGLSHCHALIHTLAKYVSRFLTISSHHMRHRHPGYAWMVEGEYRLTG